MSAPRSSPPPGLYDAFGKPPSSPGVYDAFGRRVSDSSPVKIAVDALAAFGVPGSLDDWDDCRPRAFREPPGLC